MNLKQKLAARRLSINEFAHQCGLSQDTIIDVCKGRTKPREATIAIMEKVLQSNPVINKAFRNRVLRLRVEKMMTQKELAALAGVRTRDVCMLECDMYAPHQGIIYQCIMNAAIKAKVSSRSGASRIRVDNSIVSRHQDYVKEKLNHLTIKYGYSNVDLCRILKTSKTSLRRIRNDNNPYPGTILKIYYKLRMLRINYDGKTGGA